MLISKANFAKQYDMGKSNVTKLCVGELKKATSKAGINLNSKCVVDYLKRRSERQRKTQSTPEHIGKLPDEFKDYADLTVREVVKQYGSELMFKEFLSAMDKIAGLKLKEMNLAERTGELIERSIVSNIVFDGFETLHLRLLSESSKTISRKLGSMIKSGAEPEQCEKEVKRIISKLLKLTKRGMVKGLKLARPD